MRKPGIKNYKDTAVGNWGKIQKVDLLALARYLQNIAGERKGRIEKDHKKERVTKSYPPQRLAGADSSQSVDPTILATLRAFAPGYVRRVQRYPQRKT